MNYSKYNHISYKTLLVSTKFMLTDLIIIIFNWTYIKTEGRASPGSRNL